VVVTERYDDKTRYGDDVNHKCCLQVKQLEMERTPKWLKMYRNWKKYYPSEKVNYSATVVTLCLVAFAFL